MKNLSYPQVRNLIQSNTKMFKQEAQFPDTAIMAWFEIEQPDFTSMNSAEIVRASQTFQLQKVSAQTKVNRVLAQRGLYMSQHKSVNYRIKTAVQTASKVKSYSIASAQKASRGRELNAGVTAFKSKWSRVKNSELPHV